MIEFFSYKLGEICQNITDGKHGDCKNEDNSGYYFVSSKDIYDGKFHLENARQITMKDYLDTHKRTNLEAGDILITNSGSIGRMAYVKELESNITFQKSVAIIKPDNKKVKSEFLYYYLLANTNKLIDTAGGTAQKNLLLSDMRQFDVQIPTGEVQETITKIVGSYDALIENNNRRIAILEEMAQRLYREWFVHFRFPGHENVEMVNSELGMKPEGWQAGKVGDICDRIFSGGTPTTTNNEYWNGGLPWLSSGETRNSFITDTEKTITELGVEKSSTRKANVKDVVIASAGQGKTRGQTSYLLIDTYINQSVIALRGKENVSEYLFLNIKSRYPELRSSSDSSSIRGSITTILMSGLDIIIPDCKVLKMFSEQASLVIKQIAVLQRKNAALRKTRDLLLPRLISGDIDVSAIDITISEEK